jgi:hypothetical protein
VGLHEGELEADLRAQVETLTVEVNRMRRQLDRLAVAFELFGQVMALEETDPPWLDPTSAPPRRQTPPSDRPPHPA